MVVLHVLSDPKVRNIASSIGVNMVPIQMCQQVLWCANKLIVRANDTDNKNFRVSSKKQAVVQGLTVALLPTPTKDDSNDCKKTLISTRTLSKMLGFSNGARHQAISKALKKRKEISESNADGVLSRPVGQLMGSLTRGFLMWGNM